MTGYICIALCPSPSLSIPICPETIKFTPITICVDDLSSHLLSSHLDQFAPNTTGLMRPSGPAGREVPQNLAADTATAPTPPV